MEIWKIEREENEDGKRIKKIQHVRMLCKTNRGIDEEMERQFNDRPRKQKNIWVYRMLPALGKEHLQPQQPGLLLQALERPAKS